MRRDEAHLAHIWRAPPQSAATSEACLMWMSVMQAYQQQQQQYQPQQAPQAWQPPAQVMSCSQSHFKWRSLETLAHPTCSWWHA